MLPSEVTFARFARDEATCLAGRPLPPFDEVPTWPAPGMDLLRLAANIAGESAVFDLGVGQRRRGWDIVTDRMRPAVRFLAWKFLYQPVLNCPVQHKGRSERVRYVSGTRLGLPAGALYGPVPLVAELGADAGGAPCVMIVGKAPGRSEAQEHRTFCGPAAADLHRALDELDVSAAERANWYGTNLVKHENPNTNRTSKGIDAEFLRAGPFLLWCEVFLLRPRYVLCLGSEAIKSVLGKDENVSKMLGRVEPVAWNFDRGDGREDRHRADAMGILDPAQVFFKPEMYGEFRDGLRQFVSLSRGEEQESADAGIEHVVARTLGELRHEVDRALADRARGLRAVAFDAEWSGEYPTERNARLRTVQFSHREKYACAIVLTDVEGAWCFDAPIPAVAAELRRLVADDADGPVQVGGHFFRADLPWLKEQLGLDLLGHFRPADSPEATKTTGGFDTGYMANAVNEALGKGGYKLEVLAARFCRLPRYDIPLQRWKAQELQRIRQLRKHEKADVEFDGYGSCPDNILLSYANFDVDATIRLFYLFNGHPGEPGLLDEDEFGLNAREAWWASQRSALPFLEMEMHGIRVDRNRADSLSYLCESALARLTRRFRRKIRWATFNPKSDPHCRELLFGTALNGTKDKVTGRAVRQRPDWASPRPGAWPAHPETDRHQPVTLGLTPVKPAGTKGKTWEQVVAKGEAELYNPATDRITLGILGQTNRTVRELSDLRTLRTVLQGVLRAPERGADGTPLVVGGSWVYKGGLLSWVHEDDMVRTHFFPIETGRCSSSRPNLQNISKSKEAQYELILGHFVKNKETGLVEPKGRYLDFFGRPLYRYPIRSILRARPGRVLIEADYKGAELAAIAWLADDAQMIDDVRRNALAEDDPNFLDIHAQTAVTAFKLDCVPTKKGLDSVGRAYLRNGAKGINFGTPYGISPTAVAMKCREEGTDLSDKEAEAMRDGYFTRWPKTRLYLDEAARRVADPGWICGTYGRYRRFYPTDDESVLAEMERQAWNYGIQNAVADAIAHAMWELYLYREAESARVGRNRFDFVMQIHDALLFECDPQDVEFTLRAVRTCMIERVPVYPRNLDGTAAGTGPYYFGVDVEAFENWGVKLPASRMSELGMPDAAATRAILTGAA